jgi:nucleotide sugar dehydrogenase
MDENKIPDYTALKTVGKQLHDLLVPGSLVIVESTVEPGFIEDDLIPIIEGDGRLKAGRDFGIGVCPETANPGQILNDFERLPRLVGATNEKTATIITKIYRHVFTVDLIPMPDCKTANAVKLTTNVFRDINIAFVNELAILFEKIGIDIMKVLEAAKTKYNFQVHYPGAGVGGPCLPVNSYQMLNLAKNVDPNLLRMVRVGREINEYMHQHVIDLLKDGFAEASKKIEDSQILILGVSYKPDVKDIQLTPAEPIIDKLKQLKAKVKIYDPYFKSAEVFGIKTESNLVDALNNTDAVLLVTAHKEFHDLEPTFLASKMKTPIVVDSRGIMDNHAAKKSGLIFRGLGRGKIE